MRNERYMILLFDQDGVLAQWQHNFDRRFREHAPHIDAPFLKHNSSWHMTQGLDDEGVDAVNYVMQLPGFYAELEPAEGAAEALNTALDEGHQVFICTTPYITNPTCASDKIDWAEKHIGKGWGKRMILTSDKTAVRGDFLFDDRPEVTGGFVPDWEHVLVTQPYNEHINDGRQRIDSLSQWRDIVEGAHVLPRSA
jgi:5'-nucleotidase